ncbi:MAG: hypothetical protein WAP07_04985 [Acutalibacteraceae bacterium]
MRKLLGFRDVSTTGNVYTHFTDETMKDVVNKINKRPDDKYKIIKKESAVRSGQIGIYNS